MTRHVICDLQELPVGGRVVATVADRLSVGVFNIRGQIVAFRNECPHAGAPVCTGTLGGAIISDDLYERRLDHEGCILKCPWHAWEFKLPEGVTLTQPAYRLRAYPVMVEEGKVVVDVGPASPRPVTKEPARQ